MNEPGPWMESYSSWAAPVLWKRKSVKAGGAWQAMQLPVRPGIAGASGGLSSVRKIFSPANSELWDTLSDALVDLAKVGQVRRVDGKTTPNKNHVPWTRWFDERGDHACDFSEFQAQVEQAEQAGTVKYYNQLDCHHLNPPAMS